MFRALTLAAAALSLTACAGIIPQRDPANALYRLGPLEPAYQLSASVTVREPEASRLLAGRFMSAEDEAGGISFVRSIQWSDRSTSLMQEAVLDLLGGEGGNVALPAQAGAVTDYEFSWRISDLTLKGNTARCRLEGAILKGRERSILRQTSIAADATAVGDSDSSRAQALVEAGQACARQAAAFIAETALPDPGQEPESETPAPN